MRKKTTAKIWLNVAGVCGMFSTLNVLNDMWYEGVNLFLAIALFWNIFIMHQANKYLKETQKDIDS